MMKLAKRALTEAPGKSKPEKAVAGSQAK
jgi:hypothetical protein